MRQQQHLVRLSEPALKRLKLAQQQLRVPPGRPPTLGDVVEWLLDQHDKASKTAVNVN